MLLFAKVKQSLVIDARVSIETLVERPKL